MNAGNGRNGLSWTRIVPVGTLILALLTAGGAIVRRQILDIKEAAASDRQLIRTQLEKLERSVSSVRDQIPPTSELNYRDQVLQAQINSLNERLDRLEQQRSR